MQFQNQQRQSCRCSWRYFIKWFNLKCPLLVLHLLMLLSLLFASVSFNCLCWTSLHDCLFLFKYFSTWDPFLSTQDSWPLPYGKRSLPYYEIKTGILQLSWKDKPILSHFLCPRAVSSAWNNCSPNSQQSWIILIPHISTHILISSRGLCWSPPPTTATLPLSPYMLPT